MDAMLVRRYLFVFCFLLISIGTVAWSAVSQEVGKVSGLEFNGGLSSVILDFSNLDYELILFPVVLDEEDTARTFSYTVSGSSALLKPATRKMPVVSTQRDRNYIKGLLRKEEQMFSERFGAQGNWRPPITKMSESEKIGSVRNFTYAGFKDGKKDTTIQANLVAANSRAIAYLDITATDTVKITTSDIIEILDKFSSVTYPIITKVFGKESDVDRNGKVLFLFTQLVDQEEYIAGFYRSSSLFSKKDGGDGNLADMMYIGLESSRDSYDPLLAHEFQHLVSFNQHVLVNNGSAEVNWLSEALAHYSEDLVDGHATGGMSQIYETFLGAPEIYSLTGTADTNSGIRGAGYLFLRGLVKEFGENVVTKLTQTPLSGVENLEKTTGKEFDELFASHVTRLFLSGTDLSQESKYNFSFEFFTEPLTGHRSLPMPVESRFWVNDRPLTGEVKPFAPVYLRLKGGSPSVSVNIEADLRGNFKGILIPIPQDFSPQRVLKGDYFPGLSFETPILGQYSAGTSIPISGSLSNFKLNQMLFSFQKKGEIPDTINFFTDVIKGQFRRSIVFHPLHVGDYKLKIFTGLREEGLGFSGHLDPVKVEKGQEVMLLPVDFFSGITLDNPLPVDFVSGEEFRVSGSVIDENVTELALSLNLTSNLEETVEFFIGVDKGRFNRTLVFHPTQVGSYDLQLFSGKKGENKPLVDSFKPVIIIDSRDPFMIPTNFFPGIVFSSPIPGSLPSGEIVRFSGEGSDPEVNQLLLQFDPISGSGDTIQVFIDLKNSQFNHTEIFHPSIEGKYKLVIFSGLQGKILSSVGSFSPLSIIPSSGKLSLPKDYFPGITLANVFSANVEPGQSVPLEGRVEDPDISQLLFRFEPLGISGEFPLPPALARDTIDFWPGVLDGEFNRSIVFSSNQTGEYELKIYAGQREGLKSFIKSFSPFTVAVGIDPVNLPVDFFDFVTLDEPISAAYRVGDFIPFSGQISDVLIDKLLLQFKPDGGGDIISFRTSIVRNQFKSGLVFTTTQTGSYEMTLLGSYPDGGLINLAGFSDFSVTALGLEEVNLPITGLDGIVFDSPLPTHYFVNQSTMITGALIDQSVTQLFFQLDPVSDVSKQMGFWTDVNDGRFNLNFSFSAGQTGNYLLNLFGGQKGKNLPFWDSFTLIRISSGPRLVVRQPLLDFGMVTLGKSKLATITFVNKGNEKLDVSQLLSEDSQFSVSIDSFNLAAGDSLVTPVSFAPVLTGGLTGNIVIKSNSLERPEAQIFLVGIGSYATTGPEFEPSLTLWPTSLDFGEVELGDSKGLSFLIRNTGTDTLKVNTVSRSRMNGPFNVILPTVIPVFVILPGDSSVVLVEFHPEGEGEFLDSLIISGNVPEAQIKLVGSSSSIIEKTGDFDGDGQVAFSDFLLFAKIYGMSLGDSMFDKKFDLDKDENIGFQDFLIFAKSYGN